MEQEKEIIISSLSSKTISPKPGAAWKAFNVYSILGNDGITYETTDRDFYSKRTVGEKINLKYKIETKSSGGKVYSSNKIQLPSKPSPGLADLEKKIFDRLALLEKNILAAIELTRGKPTVPVEPQEASIFDGESEEGPLY